MSHLQYFLLPLLLSIFSVAAAAAPAEAATLKYGVYETTFTATKTYGNPYLEESMRATFKAPSGKSITVDGFWDGGSTWKVRFSPDETGIWTYTTASSDAGLDGKSGSVEVTASTNKGPVRRSSSNHNTLEYADGSVFAWIGDTNWDFANLSTPYNGTFQKYVDKRASQGFTIIQGAIEADGTGAAPRQIGINEGGKIFSNWSGDVINPSFFKSMDQRVQYIADKDLVLTFWFMWGFTYKAWPSGGIPGTKDQRIQRFIKYVIARYGAYNVIWGMTGEYHLSENINAFRGLGAYTKNIDPYKRLITIHPLSQKTSATDYCNESWLDIIGEQYWEPWTKYNGYIIADRNKCGKPVVNLEFGYENQDMFTWKGTSDNTRRAMWAIFIGGGGFSYGQHNITWNKSVSNWDTLLNSTASNRVKHIRTLADQLPLEDMSPDNALAKSGTAYVLRKTNAVYAAYLPNGGTVQLAVPSGISFAAKWFNTRTGAWSDLGQKNGGTQSFSAPDTNDWLLLLTTGSGGSTGDNTGSGDMGCDNNGGNGTTVSPGTVTGVMCQNHFESGTSIPFGYGAAWNTLTFNATEYLLLDLRSGAVSFFHTPTILPCNSQKWCYKIGVPFT